MRLLATLLIDSYRKDEAIEAAKAIDELCDPCGHSCFSSCGLYVFWDCDNGEIRYVGITTDLAVRFCQHNGLDITILEGGAELLRKWDERFDNSANDPGCSKVANIKAHFKRHEWLGISLYLQSAKMEPRNLRNEDYGNVLPLDDHIRRWVREHERAAIEFFEQSSGRLPEWNKVRGSSGGRRKAQAVAAEYKEMLNLADKMFKTSIPTLADEALAFVVGQQHTDFVGHATIRDVARLHESIEGRILHPARQHMKVDGLTLPEAIERVVAGDECLSEIWTKLGGEEYLKRKPQICVPTGK